MSGINAEIIDYLKLEKQVRLDGLEMMDKSAEIPQRLLKEVSIFDRWVEHLANGVNAGEKQCNLPVVVCSTDWEQAISEHETAADFAIFIINETVVNIEPYQNGTGLYIDYETIYKNCLPKEVD